MPEIFASVGTAIAIVKNLGDIASQIRNAEIKGLVADLSLELAEIKMQLAAALEEKTALESRIRELEQPQADPCPKCRRRTYELVSSRPHPRLGRVGATNRVYKCTECGFSETKLHTGQG